MVFFDVEFFKCTTDDTKQRVTEAVKKRSKNKFVKAKQQ